MTKKQSRDVSTSYLCSELFYDMYKNKIIVHIHEGKCTVIYEGDNDILLGYVRKFFHADDIESREYDKRFNQTTINFYL